MACNLVPRKGHDVAQDIAYVEGSHVYDSLRREQTNPVNDLCCTLRVRGGPLEACCRFGNIRREAV
ncbi:hypothetical protein GCM10027093_44480 [Paraburkholderia jirisanensis]